MTKMIPLAAIGVTRKGVTVYPSVGTDKDGEPFDFTAEEISQIQALEKANDVQMLRKLRNEGSDETGTPTLDKTPAGEAGAPKTFTVANKADELKAEATARGLDFSTLTTKKQLVDLLDANPVNTETPAEGDDEDL